MAFQASFAVCIVLRSCRYNEWGRAAASFQMAGLNTDQGHSFFFTAYYTEDEVRECENLRSASNPDNMAISNHSDTQAVDPALLPSLPRSENQYNEDYTDYARQVHHPAYGSWPVSEPFEEWACRHTIACGAPGVGNWYFLPHKAFPCGNNVNDSKLNFAPKENVWLLHTTPPIHQFTAEARDVRLWTTWSISMYSIKLKPSYGTSLRWTSPRFLCSRAFPLQSKINSSEGLSTPSLHIRMNFSKLCVPRILRPVLAAPPQPPLLLQGKLLRAIPSPASPT